MNKVIVIGTVHSEGGVCTSSNLIKIIQNISPSVVFCEACPETFPTMLRAFENFDTLEIKVLRTIIEKNSLDIIPIDICRDPFDGRLEAMYELFRNKMREYFCATEIHANETYRLGFPYLNGEDSDQIHKDKSSMEKIFVSGANNSSLSQTYIDWLRWNDKRENHWIDQIQNYFKKNEIRTAIFLVGSAHRIRLMGKIKNSPDNRELFLKWDFQPFKYDP